MKVLQSKLELQEMENENSEIKNQSKLRKTTLYIAQMLGIILDPNGKNSK